MSNYKLNPLNLNHLTSATLRKPAVLRSIALENSNSINLNKKRLRRANMTANQTALLTPENVNTLVNSKCGSVLSNSSHSRIKHFIEINKVLGPTDLFSPMVQDRRGRLDKINQSTFLKPTLPIRPKEIRNIKNIRLRQLKDRHQELTRSIDDRRALIEDKCQEHNLQLSDSEKLSYMKLPIEVAKQFLARRIEAHRKNVAASRV